MRCSPTYFPLIGAIRRVRREVPAAAEVIAQHRTAHDYDDPGQTGHYLGRQDSP
jgi:hypothetical protein